MLFADRFDFLINKVMNGIMLTLFAWGPLIIVKSIWQQTLNSLLSHMWQSYYHMDMTSQGQCYRVKSHMRGKCYTTLFLKYFPVLELFFKKNEEATHMNQSSFLRGSQISSEYVWVLNVDLSFCSLPLVKMGSETVLAPGDEEAWYTLVWIP